MGGDQKHGRLQVRQRYTIKGRECRGLPSPPGLFVVCVVPNWNILGYRSECLHNLPGRLDHANGHIRWLQEVLQGDRLPRHRPRFGGRRMRRRLSPSIEPGRMPDSGRRCRVAFEWAEGRTKVASGPAQRLQQIRFSRNVQLVPGLGCLAPRRMRFLRTVRVRDERFK